IRVSQTQGRADLSRAVIEPDSRLRSRGVVPKKICLAVAVQIRRLDYFPVGMSQQQGRAGHAGAVHQPGGGLTGRGVLPKKVRLVVAVEIDIRRLRSYA